MPGVSQNVKLSSLQIMIFSVVSCILTLLSAATSKERMFGPTTKGREFGHT